MFKEDCKIEKNILYDGKLFYEDRYKSSNYPNIINYRLKKTKKK